MQQVACTLDSGRMAERRGRWEELADGSFVERVETADGLRLVFRRDDGVDAELRKLAGLERECCAFATWKVSVAGGVVRLDVKGVGTDAVAAVHGMFRQLGG
jgi:hypothetical protein